MSPAVMKRLAAASEALEALAAVLPNVDKADLPDVGGRLKGIGKQAENLREAAGTRVRKFLKEREGELIGANFRAVLSIIASERVDTKALREELPDVATRFTVPVKQVRVDYTAR